MDSNLREIVEKTSRKFGLEEYRLETWELGKRFSDKGKRIYTFNMEWFPKYTPELIDEDVNPIGSASIEYVITEKQYSSVVFNQEKSFSTEILFSSGTVEEVAEWVLRETGLVLGEHIRLTEVQEKGFHFQSSVDGIDLSPGVMINVKFDDEGRLTYYNLYGTPLHGNEIKKESFLMSLEEIETIVKQQLQLVKLPSEENKQFIPVYAMEEVYITVSNHKLLPFFVHERSEVNVDERFEWTTPSMIDLKREELFFTSEVKAEEAFSDHSERSTVQLSDYELLRSIELTKDVVSTVFPDDSGKWKVDTISREENFIQVKCRLAQVEGSGFKRVFAVFIDSDDFTLLNYLDNEELFAMFESFEVAEKEVVTHDEAFEMLLPSITLDPTYVYDPATRKYVLCGLLDSSDCVHAVTGEIIALQDI